MAIVKVEMTNRQVLTLAASIATCCLIGLEQHLPSHAAMSRKIRALEKEIANLAALSGQQLDEDMVDIGTGAWGAAMSYVAKRMKAVQMANIKWVKCSCGVLHSDKRENGKCGICNHKQDLADANKCTDPADIPNERPTEYLGGRFT